MTAQEAKEQVREMKKLARRLAESPEAAKKLLVKAGILTAKGNLRKPYK